MARVSGCQRASISAVASGTAPSGGQEPGVSVMVVLEAGQELTDHRTELLRLDEEGVVPVRAVELDVAGRDAGLPGQLGDLPRLVRRVEDVAADAHRQHRRPQAGE